MATYLADSAWRGQVKVTPLGLARCAAARAAPVRATIAAGSTRASTPAASPKRPALDVTFVQDNHSRSAARRAARPPLPAAACRAGQARARRRRRHPRCGRRHPPLVADLRPMGRRTLTPSNRRQLWVPAGFAHGFVALEDGTEVALQDHRFLPQDGRALDPLGRSDLAIAWPEGLDAGPRRQGRRTRPRSPPPTYSAERSAAKGPSAPSQLSHSPSPVSRVLASGY